MSLNGKIYTDQQMLIKSDPQLKDKIELEKVQ